MTDAKALLPLREVTSRLRILGQHDVGVRTIPIASIIGSVDRTVDFDRFFRTGRRELLERVEGLRAAFQGREMPPISVYEAGGMQFVSTSSSSSTPSSTASSRSERACSCTTPMRRSSSRGRSATASSCRWSRRMRTS